MAISLEELRGALTDHAETATPRSELLAADRLDGVRRVLRARRRRQVGSMAAALALVLVGGVMVGVNALGPHARALAPAVRTDRSNPVVNGLPDYAYGGQQIGSAWLPVPVGRTHLFTATPTSYDLTLGVTCTGAPDTAQYTVLVDGHPMVSGGCDGGMDGDSGSFADPAALWKSLGVRLGRPVEVDVTVPASTGAGWTPRVSAALYQAVPVSAYPFPARPASVSPPATVGHPLGDTIDLGFPATGGPTLPAVNGIRGDTTRYRTDLAVSAATTAPGLIEVLVNGRLVGGFASWDYTSNGYTLDLTPDTLAQAGVHAVVGTDVAVSVRVSRFAQADYLIELGRDRP